MYVSVADPGPGRAYSDDISVGEDGFNDLDGVGDVDMKLGKGKLRHTMT